MSQSLSSRAMSFDIEYYGTLSCNWRVSIPFEQGDVFRQAGLGITEGGWVSIPFEQGDVFRPITSRQAKALKVSIPFEQGDVFRRIKMKEFTTDDQVSIPFEQGDVFRPTWREN